MFSNSMRVRVHPHQCSWLSKKSLDYSGLPVFCLANPSICLLTETTCLSLGEDFHGLSSTYLVVQPSLSPLLVLIPCPALAIIPDFIFQAKFENLMIMAAVMAVSTCPLMSMSMRLTISTFKVEQTSSQSLSSTSYG